MSFIKPDKEIKASMRIRMSSKDVFYAGGIINGSRSITLMGEVATRLLVLHDGNEGRCLGYDEINLKNSIFAGDYLEVIGRVIGIDGNKRKIQCRTFKIAEDARIEKKPSAVNVLENPILCTEFIGTFEVPKK